MKNIKFLTLFLLLLVIPFVTSSMTVETQSNLNGIGGTPFGFDCLGSCYTGGLDYMALYNTSVASGVMGKYGISGTFFNSHVSKSFYDNNWVVVYLDSKNQKIKVLRYTGDSEFDVIFDVSLASVGTVLNTQEGVLFDYDGDGRDDFVFGVNDGGTYKLVYFSLSALGVWSSHIVKSDIGDECQRTLITCGNFGGIASGYISGEGRQCFGTFGSDTYKIYGYKEDGTQTFYYSTVSANNNGMYAGTVTFPQNLIIKDINSDGVLEVILSSGSNGYGFMVVSETGTGLFHSSGAYITNGFLCNIGRMTGTNNEYLACQSSDAGSTSFLLYDEAGNNLFIKNVSSTKDYTLFPPVFVDVVGGGSGKEVCYEYTLSSDSKIHFKCYLEDGTELGDYSGSITAADTTKWVKQNFVNFKYMEDMYYHGSQYYTIMTSPEGIIGVDFSTSYTTASVIYINPMTNLIDNTYASKTQYKMPSWADIDCDGKIDLIVSACDSDNSPCETRTYLSSNGTSHCSETVTGGNTVPVIEQQSTNTLGNALCLGQTYHFNVLVRDYECNNVTAAWDMIGIGNFYYPYSYFGYKSTSTGGTCGSFGGFNWFAQDINTNDFGIGSFTWNVTVKDNVNLTAYNTSALNYTICSPTNISCSCYAPNSNMTNITTITGNVTSVYYNGTYINISGMNTSAQIRSQWCADDNESFMCVYGGFLSDNAKIKSSADWMIVGLIFTLAVTAFAGYVSKFNGMVMIASFVVGLLIASGLGFFGTWIPILIGVLIIGGLGYFGFQKMQGGQ